MLVVLDTNVILSSLFSRTGAPAQVIKYWEAGDFDVSISRSLLSELERTLEYPKVKKYIKSQAAAEALFERLSEISILVEPQFRLDVIKRDTADNRVVECAKAAGAKYIVTGDDDLLELKEYEGIIILSPAEFITLLKLEKKQ